MKKRRIHQLRHQKKAIYQDKDYSLQSTHKDLIFLNKIHRINADN
jgi:hypothetical protein